MNTGISAGGELRRHIASYQPYNAQEEADKAFMLKQLPRADVLSREALAHMTVSVWTVDPALTQTLLVYHRIYQSWSWIGGHADGRQDLAAVGLRELEEETGLAAAQLVDLPAGGIYSLEVLPVAGHMRRGAYVSSHVHMNVTYLAVADPAEPVRIAPDENSAVKWFALDQVEQVSREPWMCQHVYRKLIAKLADLPAETGLLAATVSAAGL